MKKYKLIKKFPGSDELGTIITGSKETMYSKGLGCRNYDWAHVEIHPEFWEEVVEKDYEILSYIKKGSTTCTTTKRRGGENHEEFWNIYSVKRLSDGEIFTVGDTVRIYEHGPRKTIETITTNSIRSSIKQGVWFTYNSGSSHMDHAIRQKPQPIYLTHDGKDIFEGDKVWWVNKEAFYYDYFPAFSGLKFSTDINAYFLTEEEAENYIIENKPVLSIKDFWEITGMSTSNFNRNVYMKNLVKERLNLK